MTTGRIVTVFGSSRPVAGDPEYRQAYEVGRMLAAEGFIICTGGYGGVMEAAARGARELPASPMDPGHRTIGVVARAFAGRKANRWIDRVITVDSMVDRLLKLVSLGDAYVVLRGGTGTLLELATVWEFMHKNVMQQKPAVIVGSFWDAVVRTVGDEVQREGKTGLSVSVVSTAEECAAALRERLSAP